MPRLLNSFKSLGDLATPHNLTLVPGDRQPELSQWGMRPPDRQALVVTSPTRVSDLAAAGAESEARLSRSFLCSAASSSAYPAQRLT